MPRYMILCLVLVGTLIRLNATAVVAAPTLGPAQLSLSDLPSADVYFVQGTFDTSANPEAVWHVLSDYQGLTHIVGGLESSRVLQRRGNEVQLEQVMKGRFLVFGRTLVLRLNATESAHRHIDFSLYGKGPFRSYRGSWTITDLAAGCRVDYRLKVSRGDLAPRFLERNLFSKNAADLLKALKAEVERRVSVSGMHVVAVK